MLRKKILLYHDTLLFIELVSLHKISVRYENISEEFSVRYYDIYPPVSGSFHSLARCFSHVFPNGNRATRNQVGREDGGFSFAWYERW